MNKRNTRGRKRPNKAKGRRGLTDVLRTGVGGKELKRSSQPLTLNWTSVSSGGRTQEITQLVTQGLLLGQRLGRRIHPKSIQIRGLLQGGQSNVVADDPYNLFRIVVLWGTPNTAFSTITYNGPIEPRLIPGLQRVVVDRYIKLATTARDSVGYIPALQHVDIHLPLSGEVDFYDEVGNFTTSHSLYIYMVSDSVLIPHPGFVDGYWAFEFTN